MFLKILRLYIYLVQPRSKHAISKLHDFAFASVIIVINAGIYIFKVV